MHKHIRPDIVLRDTSGIYVIRHIERSRLYVGSTSSTCMRSTLATITAERCNETGQNRDKALSCLHQQSRSAQTQWAYGSMHSSIFLRTCAVSALVGRHCITMPRSPPMAFRHTSFAMCISMSLITWTGHAWLYALVNRQRSRCGVAGYAGGIDDRPLPTLSSTVRHQQPPLRRRGLLPGLRQVVDRTSSGRRHDRADQAR